MSTKKEIKDIDKYIALIPEYFDRFLKLMTSTKQSTQPEVEAIFRTFYKSLYGEKEAKKLQKVILLDSPKQVLDYARLATVYVGKDAKKVKDLPPTLAEMEIFAASKGVKPNMKLTLEGSSLGSFELYWMARRVFAREQLSEQLEVTDDVKELADTGLAVMQVVNQYLSYDTVVIASSLPTSIMLDDRNRLHHEADHAIKYADGTGYYFLSGLLFNNESWFFNPNLSDIEKAQKILTIQNVEQRQEALRVFGMNKVYTLLDRQVLEIGCENTPFEGYELWTIDLGISTGPSKYLKMVNPSTKEIHVEAVHDNVKSLKDALKFRTPGRQVERYGYAPQKFVGRT